MAEIRESWLGLTQEDALMPDLPICDAHHHLWYGEHHYHLEDFLKDVSGGHHIVRTVFVESREMPPKSGPEEIRPVGETEYVARIVSGIKKNQTNVAAGIVGFADLMLGAAVTPVLEAHIAASPERFRGIRYVTAYDPVGEIRPRRPGGLMLDAKFRAGFACLKTYGLSFDAFVFHSQLNELLDLARTFPEIPIIVNHAGGPLGAGGYSGKREAVFSEWQRAMSALASCPNVYVKLGGFGMEIYGFGWQEMPAPPGSAMLAAACAPYFSHCIERFGVRRCMFESNFPVDKRSYGYTILWNAFKRLTSGFPENERRALFHDTAVKAYRLKSD